MTGTGLRWIVVLFGFGLLLMVVAGSPPPPRTQSLAAPLGQATATSTATATDTPLPTATATPFPYVDRASIGAPDDPESASGDGSAIAILKRLRTELTAPVGVSVTAWSTPDPVGYTTPVVSIATVGATPGTTPVVAANTARLYLLCTNDNGTNPVYLNPVATPAVGHGIRLNQNGGTYEMSSRLGNLYTGALYAVATQTTSSLTCVEGQ